MAQAPDVVRISVDLPGIADRPVNTDVGTIYDVAINGTGYMLAENPETDVQWKRGTINLDPDRLATGDTPFAQAIERYTFFTTGGFSAGAGQRYAEDDNATSKGFWSSKGIDPFTQEKTGRLLPRAVRATTTTYANPRTTVVGNVLFMQNGADSLKYSSGGTWSSLAGLTDSTGPVAISGLTSDGVNWYAATGRSVIKGLLSNPGADWSTLDAVDVQWAAGRIMAAVKDGTSTTPNKLVSLDYDGADEDTPNGLIILDDGQTVVLGAAESGFYYFGAASGSHGSVYAWKLGVDDTGAHFVPYVAWDLPDGLVPVAVAGEGGSVWVAAYTPEGPSKGQAVIYRCVPDGNGALVPFLVTNLNELGGSTDMSNITFTSSRDMVYFAWSEMHSGESGVGAVSLVTGGYAPWLRGLTGNTVTGVEMWQGRLAFSVAGDGLYWESLDQFTASGFITSSVSDGGSSLSKVYDSVIVTTRPIGAGQSIEVEASYDDMGSWVPVGTIDTPGQTKQEFTLGKKADKIAIRAILAGDTYSTPTLLRVQVKFHPLGLADKILILPIDCGDNLTGLNGAPLKENRKGIGALRSRQLETLSQTRVRVQDIDWHYLGVTETYEVLSSSSAMVGLYDRNVPGKSMRIVTTLTLRKVGIFDPGEAPTGLLVL